MIEKQAFRGNSRIIEIDYNKLRNIVSPRVGAVVLEKQAFREKSRNIEIDYNKLRNNSLTQSRSISPREVYICRYVAVGMSHSKHLCELLNGERFHSGRFKV